MRIMIADDSMEIARRLQRLLLELPFVSSVVVSPTIDAAITGLMSMQPDLLILDHHFPDGKGLDILRNAGILSDTVHILVFSAYADSLEIEPYKSFPVDALLDKSRDLDTLLDMVGSMYETKMSRIADEARPN